MADTKGRTAAGGGATGTATATATEGTGTTGTPDVTYNLVSIIYHALQGAETYDQFIADAKGSGNKELAKFFQDVKRENQKRAERAMQLLNQQQQGQGQQAGA